MPKGNHVELRALVEQSTPALRAQAAANPTSIAPLLRERILQLGLAAEARTKGLDQRPEIQQRMNDAREAILVQAYLSEVSKPAPSFPSEADIATATLFGHLALPAMLLISRQ